MLHGWGGDLNSFALTRKFLSKFCRVTVIEQYGAGNSVATDNTYSMEDYATDVTRVIEKESISNPIIIGHSFGGRVAMELAVNKKVNKIVLVDSAGLRPKRSLRYYTRLFKYKLRKKFHLSVADCGSDDYRNCSPCMKEIFKRIVNKFYDKNLSDITADCLIIWGDADKVTPTYMAKRFNRGIVNSGLVYIKGGHYAYVEDAAAFHAVLRSYIVRGD